MTKDEFSIGESSTRLLSKKELIDMINNTFPDDFGSVAVLTECKTTDWDTKETVTIQSVTFGKLLQRH